MKRKLILLTIIMCIVFIPLTSMAYNVQGYGYHSPTLRVNVPIVNNSKYTTPYRNAQSAWNGAVSKISWLNDNNAKNNITVISIADRYLGRYSRGYKSMVVKNFNKVSNFNIYINDRQIPADYSYRQSVIAHEMGHALCLGHVSSSKALMSHNRNRYQIYKPQADDIAGVKVAY